MLMELEVEVQHGKEGRSINLCLACLLERAMRGLFLGMVYNSKMEVFVLLFHVLLTNTPTNALKLMIMPILQ